MAILFILGVCLSSSLAAPNREGEPADTRHVDFLMPEVQPQAPDTYLCKPMKMTENPEYLVGFQPHADMNIAHHMLLYGCSSPGRNKPVWNCGEMASHGGSYERGPVCGDGAKILYAWAMDAPALKLPAEVGFKVGSDTGVNYLVLQVHYKNVQPFLPPVSGKDSSGITMTVTDIPQRRRAGVYLLGTSGRLMPHTITYMETACPYNNDFKVYPFAFRTHAHTLGQVTSGYRIRGRQWTEIGRKSPQLPQMFYNATTPGLDIRKGDMLVARCTMNNSLNHEVDIGSTQNDEMCNFYMMYYTEEADTIMPSTYCFSAGPPTYYWASDARMVANIDNMPSTVSTLPGTNKIIKQTAEPGLYEDEGTANYLDTMYDVKGADMNADPASLQPYELETLIEYLKARGPRSDDYTY